MLSFIKLLQQSQVGKYALVQILSKLLTLISNYIIATHSSNTVFGYITVLQASLLVSITFFGFNLQNAFMRYYFERPLKDIYTKVAPIYIGLICITLLFSTIIAFYFYHHKYYFWFSLLPIIGLGNGIVLVVSLLARSNKKISVYAQTELVRPISLAFLSTFFILNPKLEIISHYIFTLFISMCITLFLCYINKNKLSYNETLQSPSSNSFTSKSILLYIFPLFLVQIMSLINNISDRYILQLFVSISEIGLYGKAYLIGSSIGLLFDSLMLLWSPFVMKNKNGLVIKYFQTIRKFALSTFALSLFLLMISILLYYFDFYSYDISKKLIVTTTIVCSAFIARIGYQLITPLYNAYDKTTLVAKISFFSMIFGFIFNFILIPMTGIYGAAIATYLSFASFSLLSLSLLKQPKNEVSTQ